MLQPAINKSQIEPNTAISIIMATYNDSEKLPITLQSIINQSISTWTLHLTDDGSSPEHQKRIDAIVSSFSRPLHFTRNSNNIGLSRSLNQMIYNVNDPYIARIDSGDAMHPKRLEEQVRYLHNYHEVMAVGSNCIVGKAGKARYPGNLTTWHLALCNNKIAHPSVCIRTESLKALGGYSSKYRLAQDFDLWFRLLKVGLIHNLPDFLTTLDLTPTSASFARRKEQSNASISIIIDNIKKSPWSIALYVGLLNQLLHWCIPGNIGLLKWRIRSFLQFSHHKQ